MILSLYAYAAKHAPSFPWSPPLPVNLHEIALTPSLVHRIDAPQDGDTEPV